MFWRRHEAIQAALRSLPDSARRAAQVRGGTVALLDAAEAPSPRASRGSNAILLELLRHSPEARR